MKLRLFTLTLNEQDNIAIATLLSKNEFSFQMLRHYTHIEGTDTSVQIHITKPPDFLVQDTVSG